MPVITYTDVATAIGRPISDAAEQAQVAQWIADVEMILAVRLGDLDDLTEATEQVVAYVVREAVIARMRHRADSTNDAEAVSEDNYFLRVLEPWWALLDPGESGSGAWSARPYFEADSPSVDSWA